MEGNIKAQRAVRCIGRPVIYAWPSKFKWTHHLNESHESLEAARNGHPGPTIATVTSFSSISLKSGSFPVVSFFRSCILLRTPLQCMSGHGSLFLK